jgi:hypothetical protein
MGKKKKSSKENKDKKESKVSGVLPLQQRVLSVSFTKSFGEYGDDKIFISQSGTIPDNSNETDIDYTFEEMFRQVKDKVEELGERIAEEKQEYYD